MLVLLRGFGMCCGLIMAIGAQNAFVLKQGLRKQHLLLTALVCSLIDTVLITLGVLGFGHVLASFPFLITLMKYFAVIFLFCYGAFSFYSAFRPKVLELAQGSVTSKKKTVALLCSFSLLNPHVYLDTVILLGSISLGYSFHDQIYFTLGAILASFFWFFSLTFGASLMAPLLQKKWVWRAIDCAIGLIMWCLALTGIYLIN